MTASEQDHQQGLELFKQSRYAESAYWIEQAIGKHPTSELWNDWAFAHMFRGDPFQAEQGFRLALSMDGKNPEATTNLALLLLRLGRHLEAVTILENALPHFPENFKRAAHELLERCRVNHPPELGLPLAQVSAGAINLPLPALSVNLPGPRPVPSARLRVAPARDLFRAGRMDFVVKERFFHSLATGVGREYATGLYRRHIQARTAGVEPSDFRGLPSEKQSIDAYVRSAEDLFASIRDHGFDPGRPVPYGRNGLPLNGAHRIACAAALGRDVVVEDCDFEGGPWDLTWFEQAGFSKADRLAILHRLVELIPERSVVFLLWAPVVDHWEQLTQALAGKIPMAGYVDLAWPAAEQPVFESLVYDTYSTSVSSLVHDFGRIDRKLGFLRGKPGFLRIGVCLASPENAHTVFARVPEMKAELRELVKHVAPIDQFVTCHLSDSAPEALHMARTLLSPANLASARLRPSAQPRREFIEWLDGYRKALAAEQLDAEDCCIVGSAVLEPIGIRLATDIDFTVRKALRAARFGSGNAKLRPGLDIVTEGYHRVTEGTPFTDDQLIDTPGLHIRFRGFKMAAPFIVRDRKDFSRRPKDCLDVELMDARITPSELQCMKRF